MLGLPGLDAYLTTPPEEVAVSGDVEFEVFRPWPRSDEPDGEVGITVDAIVSDGRFESAGFAGRAFELSEDERGLAEYLVAERSWADARDDDRRHEEW